MKINNYAMRPNFGHKILIDIGASNPKGTLKITALSDMGKTILRENSPNSYLNDTVKGFYNGQDFINKIAKVIKRTYNRVLLKHESGEFPLTEIDKLLAGVVVFVPGTTFTQGNSHNKIAFLPNLRDKDGESLSNIDFREYEEKMLDSEKETGIKINNEKFKLVVTKDLGGTGVALAKLLVQKKMLNEGDYVMGIMTGGGFGSVDIKVRNNLVEFETSESSSYVAGNYDVYGQISELLYKTLSSNSPKDNLEKLTANYNEGLKDNLQILGKLGRQGVNVKSHIQAFCSAIKRPDLTALLQAIGDARIVEMNRMCVSEKDTQLINKLKSMQDEFTEIETTTDGKIAFKMNEDVFGKENLQNARTEAINQYANSIALISINKINDCINKVVLIGPFAHGVNQYVKTHSEDFGNAQDLPELVKNKIKTHIDEKHIDLPSTRRLMELYDFKIICDKDINIPDNTASGELFLEKRLKFTQNRGSWFSIPLKSLKNENKAS